MECDDDETHEDVDHEEGDNDDVDEVEDGHDRPVVVDRADVLRVRIDGNVKDAGPTFKRRHDEQGQHGLGHVVVVEGVPFPNALLDDRVAQVAVLVDDELTLALILGRLGLVRAHEEFALKQLDADDGEHELEQQRDEDDVADSLDGHDDALHDVFKAFGSVNGSQRTQHPQHTKDLDHGYGTGTAIIKCHY